MICRALAASRKVYRCVEPAELGKIAGTVHHGGIVAVIAERQLRPPRPEEVRRWARAGDALLLLDRIGNAHNLGAIVRTAAFFGVPRIVIPDHPQQARPGEATYRIAEGGMEHVEIFAVKSLAGFMRDLRPFYLVVGATVHGTDPLERRAERSPRHRPPAAGASRPMALVLGNEERGLAAEVEAACERRVRIPGRGAIESLNVAAAAAILLHHFFGSFPER